MDREELAYIRRESLDIYNRLHSIAEDCAFVDLVRESYPSIPMLPNLRCGAWYTDPGKSSVDIPGAYFKSTDGHFGVWNFNLRRPNLNLLPLLEQFRGIILVDSTRAGKRIPDALAKTVPIWCAVMNRAMRKRYPEIEQSWRSFERLYSPPTSVSAQEHSQIEERLESWGILLAESSYDLPKLPRPIRPMWITPATSTLPYVDLSPECPFYTVFCLSASKQVGEGVERRTSGFSYVQGSGDDHELWGMGLTPQMFWLHQPRLLQESRAGLPSLIEELVASNCTTPIGRVTSITRVQGRVMISALSGLPSMENLAQVIISDEATMVLDTSPSRPTVHLGYGNGKHAHFAQIIIPADQFIQKHLQLGRRVCISCPTGNDTAVGIALVVVQKYFDENGNLQLNKDSPETAIATISKSQLNKDSPEIATATISKNSIRKRLEWIISDRPEANPSRATLKRVNEYLLSTPHRPNT